MDTIFIVPNKFGLFKNSETKNFGGQSKATRGELPNNHGTQRNPFTFKTNMQTNFY
jgi:hypothetical protein